MNILRLFLITLFACITFSHASLAASPADVIEHKTNAGASYWLMEDHYLPIVSIRFSFARSGAAYTSKAHQGLAYMVAAMLDEGAGTLSAHHFHAELEAIATDINFWVDHDYFYVQVKTLSKHIPRALELLSLALTEPQFSDDAIARVRNQIVTLLSRQKEQPYTIASHALQKNIFGEHPYAWVAQGTEASIEKLSKKDLKLFVKNHLTREHLRISIVGDVKADSIAPLLDKALAPLPAKGKPVKALKNATFHAPSQPIISIPFAVPQSIVLMAMPAPLRASDAFYPSFIMNHILGGGGFESRLMNEIREKKGLVYSVYSTIEPYHKSSILSAYAATENARVHKTITALKSELSRMHDKSITPKELSDAKRYLIHSFPLKMTQNAKLVGFLDAMQRDNLGIDFMTKRNSKVSAVTLEDVNQAASMWLDPKRTHVIVIGQPSAE